MILAGGLPGFGKGLEVIAFLLLAAIVFVCIGAVLLVRFIWRRTRLNRYLTPVAHQLVDRAELTRGLERVQRQLKSIDQGTDQEFRLRLQRGEYAQALGEEASTVRAYMAEAVALGLARLGLANLGRFIEILFLAVAFGTDEQRRIAAGKWKRRHVLPDEPASLVALGEGIVRLIDGDRAVAREQLAGAAKTERRRMLAWIAAAGVSIVDRDGPGFERHIMASLVEYGKDYRRQPEDPAGAMNIFALALCQLGLDEGLRVAEMAYLPLTLPPHTTTFEHAEG